MSHCCSISELIYIRGKSISYLRSPKLLTEAVRGNSRFRERSPRLKLLLTKPKKLESLLFLAS